MSTFKKSVLAIVSVAAMISCISAIESNLHSGRHLTSVIHCLGQRSAAQDDSTNGD